MFLQGQRRPRPKEGPAFPQLIEISQMRAHGTRNNNQILHGDQGDNFLQVDHAPPLVKNFVDTNADARSVCGC